MTDLEQLADQMATHEYLSQGYFGGKKSYGSKNIQYFDFQGMKQKFIEQLKNKKGGEK